MDELSTTHADSRTREPVRCVRREAAGDVTRTTLGERTVHIAVAEPVPVVGDCVDLEYFRSDARHAR